MGQQPPQQEQQEQQEQRDAQQRAADDYNVTTEIFIGGMLTIIGVLVLVTPAFSELPRDLPISPVLLDVAIGLLYVAIGAGVFHRAWRKRAKAPDRPS